MASTKVVSIERRQSTGRTAESRRVGSETRHGRSRSVATSCAALPPQSDGEARRDTVPVRLLPDRLIAIGELVASVERICSPVGLSPRSVHSGLSRLRRQGRLFSPARGLHVAVPPEYRSWGVVPASWFIDAMMQHLGRSYYVGLLTAAAVHGASHQHAQVFQVMVDRQLGDRGIPRAGRFRHGRGP